MSETPVFSPGRFVWHELMTSDTGAAKRFYGELFGWTTKDVDMGGFTYTMLSAGEVGVGGMMTLDPNHGVPPHWMSYVSVDDVDAVVERARAAGATIGVEPQDIPHVGRFAVIGDPQGAWISPFKSAHGDGEEPTTPANGVFCWDQIATTDVQATKDFYTKVFPWTIHEFAPGMETFAGSGRPRASIVEAPPGTPSHWLTFVVVPNLADARRRVGSLGGHVLVEQIDVPNVGSFSVIADPQGAVIAAFQGT